MALVLGAQVYKGVEFCDLEEPDDDHENSGKGKFKCLHYAVLESKGKMKRLF